MDVETGCRVNFGYVIDGDIHDGEIVWGCEVGVGDVVGNLNILTFDLSELKGDPFSA